MQENRRSNERSALSFPVYGPKGETALCDVFFRIAKQLVFSVLFVFNLGLFAKGQISNELVFDSLVYSEMQKRKANINHLTGFLTIGIQNQIDTLSGGKDSLEIEAPIVNYEKLGEGRILRKIETDLIFKSGKEERNHVEYSDTLQRKDLKAIRTTKYQPLKGDHPGNIAKFLWPSLGVGTGVGIVLSLFYIRS